MPCWTPFPENIGTVHDVQGNLLEPELMAASHGGDEKA
jgi:hypothetical protein